MGCHCWRDQIGAANQLGGGSSYPRGSGSLTPPPRAGAGQLTTGGRVATTVTCVKFAAPFELCMKPQFNVELCMKLQFNVELCMKPQTKYAGPLPLALPSKHVAVTADSDSDPDQLHHSSHVSDSDSAAWRTRDHDRDPSCVSDSLADSEPLSPCLSTRRP